MHFKICFVYTFDPNLFLISLNMNLLDRTYRVHPLTSSLFNPNYNALGFEYIQHLWPFLFWSWILRSVLSIVLY